MYLFLIPLPCFHGPVLLRKCNLEITCTLEYSPYRPFRSQKSERRLPKNKKPAGTARGRMVTPETGHH